MLKLGTLHLLDLFLHIGNEPFLSQLPVIVSFFLQGGANPCHSIQTGLHLCQVVDGGLQGAKDVPVSLHNHQLLDNFLQVVEVGSVGGQAQQTLQNRQQGNNFEADVCHRVLGQTQ